MKIKYILCERAWSQCIMGNRKMAENVLKYYWDGIFCNVIVLNCFLELVETPTVFFFKNLILGQCYTFVHQNCATDLNTFMYFFSVFYLIYTLQKCSICSVSLWEKISHSRSTRTAPAQQIATWHPEEINTGLTQDNFLMKNLKRGKSLL